jgi:hypothetical protein
MRHGRIWNEGFDGGTLGDEYGMIRVNGQSLSREQDDKRGEQFHKSPQFG